MCYKIADCLSKEGKLEEAREFAQRAMEGRRKILGANDPDTKYAEKLYQELSSKK